MLRKAVPKTVQITSAITIASFLTTPATASTKAATTILTRTSTV
jgi:alcohol dehydrogenase YqhD (iron-dependent ADH family)